MRTSVYSSQFSGLGAHVVFKTINKLQTLLRNPIDVMFNIEESRKYEVQFKDCNSKYVGQFWMLVKTNQKWTAKKSSITQHVFEEDINSLK